MSLNEKLPDTVDAFHHAYLIRGASKGLFEVLERVFGITETGHPDLYRYQADSLRIDEAREIRHEQSRRPARAPRTVFLIEVLSIESAAQHALLKVFEDPAPSTVFFLVTSPSANVLPTLRSRMHEVYGDSEQSADAERVTGEAFLAAAPGERIELVAGIVKEKDKQYARRLLDECEVRLHTRGVQEYATALDEVLRAKQYLADTGASVKLILEHLSLILPRISLST